MEERPLRVVQLVSGDAWGGLEALVLDLLTSDVYRSNAETILIAFNEGILTARVRAEGFKVIVVPETERSFLGLQQELKTLFATLRPNVIHTHRYKEILLGGLLARQVGARHIVTIHGYEPPTDNVLRVRAFIGNLLCVGTALIRGAQFVTVADHLRKRFMIPASRCRSIRNGIRITKRIPSQIDTGSREATKEPVIGWVGRMVPVKGLSTLLDAIAKLREKQFRPRVLLVGDGPQRSELEQQVKALRLSDQIQFEGFVNDIRPYYGRMDMFVLPSFHEGIPIALLEALEAGLPVVASSVGGIPSVIETSGAGVLVSSRSPSLWADALAGLLCDRAKMRIMGENARKHIEANFSIENAAKQYLSLYQQNIGSVPCN